MIALLSRFLGLLLIAAGLIAVVVDGTRSIAASTPTVTPLGQAWFVLSPKTLTEVRSGVSAYVGDWLWDPVIQSVLRLPTWFVLGGAGAVLVALGGGQRRRPALE